jgi:hypothetical protein
MERFFGLLALAGLVLTILVHIASVLGFDVSSHFPMAFRHLLCNGAEAWKWRSNSSAKQVRDDESWPGHSRDF